ncbi:MAG: hypothetical protein J1F07_08755 [Muribaculaceae bacterium]|nr:hypothetical protein [Muribaculaceae bacterium]
MKKYLKLLMLAIFASMSFAFVACGNDDDDDEPSGGNNTTGNGFVGTWSMNMIGHSGEYKNNYIRFYDDSSFILVNANEDEVMVSNGTWSVSGNTFTLDYAIAQNERPIIPYVITYNIKSQNSSKIEFYLGNLNFTFTKVSDSVMNKYQEEIEDVLGDDNGNSGDDNSSITSSTLKINGTEISRLLSTSCEENHFAGEYWVAFGSNFYYINDMVSFEIDVPFKSISQLKEGQELIDYINISGFFVLLGQNDSNIGFAGGSPRFHDIDGSVKVQKLTSSTVTLKFSNFSFTKERGNEEIEYKFNGSMTYDIN